MNRYLTYLLFVLILASCKEDIISVVDSYNADAVEISGIEAYIADGTTTRAAALDAYNYVGRSAFINNDQMVLTTIKRTVQPIKGFSYSGIVYNQVVESGQTSGGWNRDNTKGRTEESVQVPERIYWSDAHNHHTYIGYSKPQGTFDWEVKNATYEGSGTDGIPVYYGSLGDPTQLQTVDNEGVVANFIDYTNSTNETPQVDDPTNPNSASSYKSGNEKIKSDDILLTYDNAKVAETGGSVAKLYFHHGLAQVRVIVNIQGFSASTDAADSKSVVSDMILKNMLTLYKWRQMSYMAEALDERYDKNNINSIYNNGSDGPVTCDQKKDVHLWIPRPNGTGTGVGKQFTFYALAVPQTMGVDNATTDDDKAKNLHFEFKVKYPDPMNPRQDVVKTYRAMMPKSIEFRAGHCTTINIYLNHSNEEMTVGAEYMDWQLVETPDEGELKKNLTFLEDTKREKVTIIGDPLANEDDATWLYVDNTTKKIVDIYGNDGSETNPFKIATANQLLSFAYEVKGTNRVAGGYKDLSGASKTFTTGAGFDFTGYYVKLDADITMQKSLEIWHDSNGFYTLNTEGDRVAAASGAGVTWIGIGDDNHSFNGVFNGGYRHINKLYGASFFNTIGADGIVDHLFFSDALGITGRGSIAEVNNGVICGAYIEGDVEAINSGSDNSHCGSIVGENHSMLISCTHIGDIKGTNYESVGALLGYNDGIVAICYNCGNVTGGDLTYAGIGKYTLRSIAYCSYYNGDLYSGHGYDNLNSRIGHVAYPLTTAMMQSNVFVNKVATASDDGMTTTGGEIIDDGLSQKTDPFFFHLSLNGGIKRSVVMLKKAVQQTADAQGYIPIHSASGSADDPNRYEDLKLKKTLVRWLIDHYSTEKTVDGKTELEFSHQFQFIPGTYPKLQ